MVAEAVEVAYLQVDLTEQPDRILDKPWDVSCHNTSWVTSNVASNTRLPGVSHGQPASAQNMTNIEIN